jgi:hypothetical protein
MIRLLVAFVLMLSPIQFQTPRDEKPHLVLPSPKLLRCRSSDCFNLWLEAQQPKDIFPKQLHLDMNQDCIYGLTALYDKSVSAQDIESAIDEHYLASKNTDFAKTPIRIWRVESEKFAIQLSEASRRDEKREAIEAGTKQVIYIAFGGRSACTIP